jgi:hypothetical protein
VNTFDEEIFVKKRLLLASVCLISAAALLIQPANTMAFTPLFDTALVFGTGDWPQSVTTDDFNEDGHADLAVANENSDNVSILLNTTDPFSPTMLSYYLCSSIGDGIEVSWFLSEAGLFMDFLVYRREEGSGKLRPIDADIGRSGEFFYRFVDNNIEPGLSYRYRVDVSDEDGRRTLFETEAVTAPIRSLSLNQNYPNPFNPSTTISFVLQEKEHVNLSIYDVDGKLIKALLDEALSDGFNEVTWDGTDTAGSQVSSGVYLYRLKAGKTTLTKKLMLLK